MTTRRRILVGAGAFLGACITGHATTAAPARDGGDEGEFVILQARYGTEAQHVDVTQKLRDIARQHQRAQLTPALLGVDPAPGRDKVLRIYARDGQRRERRFEYPERAWIDGLQFAGWSAAHWGDASWHGGWTGNPYQDRPPEDNGQLTILYASYGIPGAAELDVTARLRGLARRDLRFRLEQHTFGVDRDTGAKRLLIVARDRLGGQCSFEYPRGSWVEGAQFAGWRTGR